MRYIETHVHASLLERTDSRLVEDVIILDKTDLLADDNIRQEC